MAGEFEGLQARLNGHRRIGIDTSVFIYALEGHEHYYQSASQLLRCLQDGQIEGIASTVALGELLVGPYRRKQLAAAHRITALLGSFPSIEWVAPSWLVNEHAARLRARMGYRLPDALHLATAIHRQATLFVTNDHALREAPHIEVLLLDDVA